MSYKIYNGLKLNGNNLETINKFNLEFKYYQNKCFLENVHNEIIESIYRYFLHQTLYKTLNDVIAQNNYSHNKFKTKSPVKIFQLALSQVFNFIAYVNDDEEKTNFNKLNPFYLYDNTDPEYLKDDNDLEFLELLNQYENSRNNDEKNEAIQNIYKDILDRSFHNATKYDKAERENDNSIFKPEPNSLEIFFSKCFLYIKEDTILGLIVNTNLYDYFMTNSSIARPYYYFDNTDKPDNICNSEWKERRANWLHCLKNKKENINGIEVPIEPHRIIVPESTTSDMFILSIYAKQQFKIDAEHIIKDVKDFHKNIDNIESRIANNCVQLLMEENILTYDTKSPSSLMNCLTYWRNYIIEGKQPETDTEHLLTEYFSEVKKRLNHLMESL